MRIIKKYVKEFIRETDHIRQCISCKDIEYSGEWIQFRVPPKYRHKISGGVCYDCMRKRYGI